MLTLWTKIKGQIKTNLLSISIVSNFTKLFFSLLFKCRSPLMITAGNGLISMLRLLLQFNAEVSLKDTKGWSADDHAVINGYHP